MRDLRDIAIRDTMIKTKFEVPVRKLDPTQQVKIYRDVLQEGAKGLPEIGQSLGKTLDETSRMTADKAAPLMRDRLNEYRDRLQPIHQNLDNALDIPQEDAELLRRQLDQCRASLAKTQQQLYDTEQRNAQLERTLDEREGFVTRQQEQIDDLQRRNNELETRIGELEQRSAIDPEGFGSALGKAVDAIQQGLTTLENPYIDYGLQEFDLDTQVNLQINDRGKLLIRFPGVNEAIAPQNLSQLQMRLRPIPKSQQVESTPSDSETDTDTLDAP
jgi:Sec-independent protein translocase protein TatA